MTITEEREAEIHFHLDTSLPDDPELLERKGYSQQSDHALGRAFLKHNQVSIYMNRFLQRWYSDYKELSSVLSWNAVQKQLADAIQSIIVHELAHLHSCNEAEAEFAEHFARGDSE